MRKRLPTALLCCFLIGLSATALAEVKVSVGPAFRYGGGDTRYILEESYEVNGTSGIDTVVLKSQLEYPMDVPMAGGRIDIDLYRLQRLDLSISASFLTDVKDPGGTMLDRDWLDNFEFSHTDSEVRLWSMLLDLDISKWVFSSNHLSFYVVGGVKAQRISQDLIGLVGWQIYDSLYQFNIPEFPVGLYEISYAMPHIGIMPKYRSERVSLDFKGALALVMVSDQDHHLLRNFITQSSGTGRGFIGRVRSRYDFPSTPGSGNMFMELSGDIVTVKANLAEKMYWYGDDPATTEDDTGTSLGGIPHEVKSTQYGIGFVLGFRF